MRLQLNIAALNCSVHECSRKITDKQLKILTYFVDMNNLCVLNYLSLENNADIQLV